MEEKRKRGRPPKAKTLMAEDIKKIKVNQDKSFDFNPFEFVIRGDENGGINMFCEEIDLTKKHKALINLNQKVMKEKPIISNFENEIKELTRLLCKYKKSNAILVGKAGIGKTALIEKLAYMIETYKIPQLRDVVIYELSLNNLISGTKYRGEFEEKIEKILEDIKGNNKVILFIDEIHNLTGLNSHSEGSNMGLGEILKPSLARGEIRVIGATTPKEYKKYISKDKALNRRFSIMEMEEPTLEETVNILIESAKLYEKHYKVKLSANEIKKIVKKAKNKKGCYPDKALDLLEEYCYRKKEEKIWN